MNYEEEKSSVSELLWGMPSSVQSYRYYDYGGSEMGEWDSIPFSRLKTSGTGPEVWILEGYSDYSGSRSIAVANESVIKEEFPQYQSVLWWVVFGGYGSQTIAIDPHVKINHEDAAAMADMLTAIAEYSVLDTEFRKMEEEKMKDEFRRDADWDMKKACIAVLAGEYEAEDFIEIVNMYKLFLIVEAETYNEVHWYEEYSSMYIDVKKMVKSLGAQRLLQLILLNFSDLIEDSEDDLLEE